MRSHRVAKSYANPIITGFNPDPSIIRVGQDYFLVTSTFEYFPGAPIYHSTDLVSWKLIGHALTRPSQIQIHTPEPGSGVWATTIRYHNGIFYVITTSFERYRPQDDDRVWPRGFCVKTDNIWDSTSWSDPVYFDEVGFDQDLFWDDDGTVYLSTTRRKLHRTPGVNLKDFAIHICTVDLETGNSTSEPLLIRESLSGVSEGSHIFKRGNYYYLFTAEGGTESGHSEWVCRSDKSPFGPWEVGPNNPLCHNGTEDDVQNIGHADFVEDTDGNWWAVLLAVRPVKKTDGKWETSVFGRETFLVPVDWVDDWPIFNGGQKISLDSGHPAVVQQKPRTWKDDFTNPDLQLGWYRKNTPKKRDYSLIERPNCLRLHGGPYKLSDPACPTLFLRKQSERFCTWETRLSFTPSSPYTEAGTVVWMDYFTYSTIGIRLKVSSNKGSNDAPKEKILQRIIRFTPPIGSDADVIEHELKSLDSDIILTISCGDGYQFSFREIVKNDTTTQEQLQCLGEVANEVMTRPPPIGLQFTGVMLGLYAFGTYHPCSTPADFHYVQVTNTSQ
ncbi:Non-reducing end alpha-L-arabinofuranosidase BoGH43B [Talaromyces pinophilus]|nr:Non-reducing end alpha-L-arabinofuranosidase BoGH43B [Talaromyces pinophilus]